MRLPTNNIAITLVGLAVTLLLVPIGLAVIYVVRFAKGLRPHRVHDKPRYGVLSPLDKLSETHPL